MLESTVKYDYKTAIKPTIQIIPQSRGTGNLSLTQQGNFRDNRANEFTLFEDSLIV